MQRRVAFEQASMRPRLGGRDWVAATPSRSHRTNRRERRIPASPHTAVRQGKGTLRPSNAIPSKPEVVPRRENSGRATKAHQDRTTSQAMACQASSVCGQLLTVERRARLRVEQLPIVVDAQSTLYKLMHVRQ